MDFSALLPPAQQGFLPSLFSVSKHKDKTKLMLQNKHLKKTSREREKKNTSLCRFGYFVLRLKHFHSVELRKKRNI